MSKSHLHKGVAYPGIVAILLRSTIAGSSAQLDSKIHQADLYLDLDLRGTGMLDFEKVRPVVRAGYEAALLRINAWLETRPHDVGATGAIRRRPLGAGFPEQTV
jgi:hypothetical protein